MPVRTVPFIPGCYYHVYNRGSEKRIIFQNRRDYSEFLTRIQDTAKKHPVDILAFCLMPNHFHFLLKQTEASSIDKFMNVLQLGYAKHFNTKYDRVGPLFQGRFKAKLVELDEYLLQLSLYIHRNPIPVLHAINRGENLLVELGKYQFSSYHEYLHPSQENLCKSDEILGYFSKTNHLLSYQTFVEGTIPDFEILAPILF